MACSMACLGSTTAAGESKQETMATSCRLTIQGSEKDRPAWEFAKRADTLPIERSSPRRRFPRPVDQPLSRQ
ncbi:hypothetical protein BO78DRAFT_238436 [Aspergillus sclerotiicarbonarius CBS 121057]|uniref:Uncharacterized protein n=1 Tax=Aspergillus sclerotiicarbonarius (strain CBS 121057 / IBT 28362) TaxID=1448318 RepID=A0A319E5U3_ASPSB|nr:hypothetical protein BO78DRAFT_238436 [Aspergillus sclerotiicarbonarius CBS 121057]